MKVLIVEDDQFKLNDIMAFFERSHPGFQILVSRSVNSAKKSLLGESFDLAVLDMSLPTFDIGVGGGGGDPKNFGGLEIIRYIARRRINCRFIVITQFAAFGEGEDSMDRETLREALANDYPALYQGMIYYASDSDWSNKLSFIIGCDD